MQKKISIDHARHNEKVCKYLNKKPEFADWVITTAFYSALHYLRNKIFPVNIAENGKKIKVTDFDNYCLIKHINKGKHSAFSNLVEEIAPELSDHYNQLKDLSWTARYNCYEYDRELSNLAMKKLEIIKSKCH